MRNVKQITRMALMAAAVTALSACSGYYLVRDPSTGSKYYTRDVDDEGDAGAIRFKDEASGSVVTLPSSEVKEISSEHYHEIVRGR
jgi:hypothetical protein